ncbi:hypothetical protein Vadar_024883 [Vaccinium darrowii]|uniref:Uncharacterized protein n=1 Tax=Vaccinium darrowii TaxID=229202 RepID=A0ACB7X3Y1_9ERIC|nr:hypothetical protein Vadar_024883 [Vaccinium darrowii]
MSCNICHKKTYEPISTIFTCESCQRKNVTAEPWCCVRVELGDATGDLPATLFGRHAEKVLACEAKALFNLDIEGQLDLMERWSTEWTITEFIFHVKVAQRRNSLRLDVMGVDDV